MTTTKIHLTKKLQKIAPKIIKKTDEIDILEGITGKWNATIFNVDRKKCWLISNGLTKYNVVLPDINAAELKNIESIFKNALFTQLTYDDIILTSSEFEKLFGKIQFFSTDNDRSTTAFQNQRLSDLQAYKLDYLSLKEMPMNKLTSC